MQQMIKVAQERCKKEQEERRGNMIWSFRKEIVTSFGIQKVMTEDGRDRDLGSISYPPVLPVNVRNLC